MAGDSRQSAFISISLLLPIADYLAELDGLGDVLADCRQPLSQSRQPGLGFVDPLSSDEELDDSGGGQSRERTRVGIQHTSHVAAQSSILGRGY